MNIMKGSMKARDTQVRETRQGFGDALSMAFEMVATPALFAFFGFLLDRTIGTTPLFILLFSCIALTYTIWKTLKGYERRMQKYERPGG